MRIKIDILDHVIRTPEVFRIVSDKTEVPVGLPEPPGKLSGLMGLVVEERRQAKRWRVPP